MKINCKPGIRSDPNYTKEKKGNLRLSYSNKITKNIEEHAMISKGLQTYP